MPQTSRFEELWGIEDPRIVRFGDEYLIAYTAVSSAGPLVALLSTRDSTISSGCRPCPPREQGRRTVPGQVRRSLCHDPPPSVLWVPGRGAHVDFVQPGSPSLGRPQDPPRVQAQVHWDQEKIGLGPPPLWTNEGWLIMFHGVKGTAAGALYRAGLAVLDPHEPTRVLARADEWVLGPEADYERTGDVPGVVFPCGWVRDDDDRVRLYYGAADTCVGLATRGWTISSNSCSRIQCEIAGEGQSVRSEIDTRARHRQLSGPDR